MKAYNSAFKWINKYTIEGNGIAVSSKEQVIYPEVTGYFIPSLLRYGEKRKAISFAEYLCNLQKEDGSWYDPTNKAPYVFDSAQIIKGLVAIRGILPKVDNHIIKGCDWIISNVKSDGRLTTPAEDAWGTDEKYCSELVHIYCLSPISYKPSIT